MLPFFRLQNFFSLCLPILFLSLSFQLEAKESRISVFAGPEVYHVKRTKKTSSEQEGTLAGVRVGIDRIKRYRIYWGADYLWASGTLKGACNGASLKSDLTDQNIEGRIGYNFQTKHDCKASFTPYFGIGYFWETNKYKDPSPLKVHLKTTFPYLPIGFFSKIFINPVLSCGVNFKIRVLWNGNQRISNDPDHPSFKQTFDPQIQYRVEAPVSYYFKCYCLPLSLALVPFYEYRPYGHQINYPFDFIETKYQLYGATLKLYYQF